MRQSNNRSASGKAVFVRLDELTNERLIHAKNRSGRSKPNELAIRLRDHLDRFPDFYNTELTEIIQNNLSAKSER